LKRSQRQSRPTLVLLALAGLVALTAAVVFTDAQAQSHHDRDHVDHAQHFDARFSHNHAYPVRGVAVAALPHERIDVVHGHDHFFVSGGVWYAPRGPRFVVVAAPFGAFVPVLPPFFTTVWFGGLPYYYANDTYYLWRGPDSGYEVVAPPGDPAAVQSPPPSDELFIYPKSGQSEEQQSADRYECHAWAVGQSGFDPSASNAGAEPPGSSRRGEYNRAMTACLEGRGYSVK